MIWTSIILLALAAIAGASNALPFPGYTEAPSQWTGSIEAGGGKMHFNGTVQEVEKQIRAIKRDFSWNHWTDLTSRNPDAYVSPDPKLGKPDCSVGGSDWVPFSQFDEGLDYLRKLSGDCHGVTGPNKCGRLSCSWNAGIWFCNDNDHEIHVSWLAVIHAADTIYYGCRDQAMVTQIHGQVFHADGWNVILGKAPC
ncbi:hypothetical protein BJ170DRAFT_698056 [Xylariales sp. AK1849]|nr:hypothetical protein BJ170DRAFT_698056 [Xylariales sp. AK1849]